MRNTEESSSNFARPWLQDVLFHITKFFLIWTFDSNSGHMRNYIPSACCYVTDTFEIFMLSSLLVWWMSFTIGLATYFLAMVTQLPWQKYDTSITREYASNHFCPRQQ